MRGLVKQSVVERVDDCEKEKKKSRRRSGRRSKTNNSVTVNGPVNGVHDEVLDCIQNGRSLDCVAASSSSYSSSKPDGLDIDIHTPNEHGLPKASNVAFNSMPTMHIIEHADQFEMQGIHNQHVFPSALDRRIFSKSCLEPVVCAGASGVITNNDLITFSHNNGYAQRKCYAPHWSMEEVSKSLKKGDVFKASFRVNAHNRLEAYCKIDKVPSDVLISGFSAQNRAVEGDIVAIKVDPFPLWTKMRGSNGISSSSMLSEHGNLLPETNDIAGHGGKGKSKVDADPEKGLHSEDSSSLGEYIHLEPLRNGNNLINGHLPSASKHMPVVSSSAENEVVDTVGTICAMISSFPSKRPTGKVVAILERSPRRDAVVGFLNVKKCFSYRESYEKDAKNNTSSLPLCESGCIHLTPTDPRFPKMVVLVKTVPDPIKERLEGGDETVESELVAARIDNWAEESLIPEARVLHSFGRGGEVEPHINAILFENAVCTAEFPPEAISCLPRVPWEVPQKEIQSRFDLRKLCIFTVDPSTATDLDDALSVEKLPNGISRIGVHIADVSHFVLPDTVLDIEAQSRSTSVYLLNGKLPMLPSLLSENLCSLNPGVERLTFSIFWDINSAGKVVDHFIGHSVIQSCCKLSYEQAQDIIDGTIAVEHCNNTSENGFPQLHGNFEWLDVIRSVRSLHEISKTLREKRINDGALQFENSKIGFLFDEDGIPYDSVLCECKDSNFLVEEFMLLANRTAAEVISRSFPDSALLRRHKEPNMRKLKEFELFCFKHGLELDTSSSRQFHLSLERIREKLKDDSVLLGILISYASRPMQLATYFCSGELKDSEREWSHYALAIPLYTHFTSPLRRYADIVVHRTLAAAIDADYLYLMNQLNTQRINKRGEVKRFFTGIYFDKDAAESLEGREALSLAAAKHRIFNRELLADVAAHCNERNLASRHVKDACDKLYMWILLKKKKILLSEARVLGLGPKFMSIYIHKLAIERRIYYDEVEGLMAEWLEATSTLVLGLCAKKCSFKRGGHGKSRALEDVAHVISPYDLKLEVGMFGDNVDNFGASDTGDCTSQHLESPNEVHPAVFPLTVHLLSTIPVALHAVGGDYGTPDIGVRLYTSSYFR